MDCNTWHPGTETPPYYEEVVVLTEDYRIGTAYYEGEWVYFVEQEEEIGGVKYWIRLPEEYGTYTD